MNETAADSSEFVLALNSKVNNQKSSIEVTDESGLLSNDVLLAKYGIYDIASSREIILREAGIGALDLTCAQDLGSLEIFSLSHNHFTSLNHFKYLVNLVELNLNFNRLTSLDGLECLGLERLYVSNNKIIDIAPLEHLKNLETLCLYRNHLEDIDAALSVCRSLPKLRALDMGGNPCTGLGTASCADTLNNKISLRSKYKIIRNLPRLKEYDGELISRLDRDLAGDELTSVIDANAKQPPPRPVTASSANRSAHITYKEELADPDLPQALDLSANRRMPRGNVRLFRDDYLNNHPLLLGYMSETVDEKPSDRYAIHIPELDLGNTEQKEANKSKPSKRFVERMRTANSQPLPDTTDDSDQIAIAEAKENSDVYVHQPKAPVSSSSDNISTHSMLDPSDPRHLIRKLLKHIETQNETIASYESGAIHHNDEQIREENRRLQIENNNIPILQQEIQDLRDRNAADVPYNVHVSRIAELEKEVAFIKAENQKLSTSIHPQKNNDPFKAKVCNKKKGQVLVPQQVGLNADAELQRESSAYDLELTELIMQNEISLSILRNEINCTKKEREEDRRKEQLFQCRQNEQIRPSTSLGFTRFE